MIDKLGARICFFFQAGDGIRVRTVTGVQTCALPILAARMLNPGGKALPRVGMPLPPIVAGAAPPVTPKGAPQNWHYYAPGVARSRPPRPQMFRDRKSVV